jgi:hypothetical protein
MAKTIHRVYVVFLVSIVLISTLTIGVYGAGYYVTPLQERPFHPQYELLKPTGLYGQGYGVIGSCMISFGVLLYSSRKRIRALANLGKIRYFLEFHIFLCLLGPILVVYHTTFKFGGLVAVSFWSMAAVVLSGVIGRYLYVQIPKGIQGNELSFTELRAANTRLAESLSRRFGLSVDFLKRIDAIATPQKLPARMSLMEVLNFFILNDLTRRSRLRAIFRRMEERGLSSHALDHIRALALRRIILTRRIAFLEQFKQIFHYWHVVHLPFSIIMFLILFVHVGVAVAFGYTWIW